MNTARLNLSDQDLKTAELLYVEGEALMEAKSYYAAVVKFDQVLAHNPWHFAALCGLTDALKHVGSWRRCAERRKRPSPPLVH